jgi:hypothetical protein
LSGWSRGEERTDNEEDFDEVQFKREGGARGDGQSEGQGEDGEGDEVSLMSKANRPDHQLDLRSRSQEEEDDGHKDRSESRLDKFLLPPLRLEAHPVQLIESQQQRHQIAERLL